MTSRSTSSRWRRPSSPVPAPPLEDDDLLHEILLRLPPQPSYLVCKRWWPLAADSHFLCRFHLHHRRPPLLGLFSQPGWSITFTPTLDSPCRIPPDRFSLPLNDWLSWDLVESRHGRVLLLNRWKHQVIVWNPITNNRSLVDFPPEFYIIHTVAVLCSANDQGHVHGSCRSWPFKVVLLGTYLEHAEQTVTSVYSSDTGLWGDLISSVLPERYRGICISSSSTLVGNTLYWLNSSAIIAFDTDNQRLVAVEKPFRVKRGDSVQIIQAEDGGLGLAAFRGADYNQRCLEIWERNPNPYGVAAWVLRKTVIPQKIFGNYMAMPHVVQYVEGVHAIFVRVQSYVFMVQLESMQSKELLRSKNDYMGTYHPFTSFYTKVTREKFEAESA